MTIANIETPPQFQRTGMFTRMVAEIRSITAWPLYLENAHTAFAKSLLRYGWEEIGTSQHDLLLTGIIQAPSTSRDAT